MCSADLSSRSSEDGRKANRARLAAEALLLPALAAFAACADSDGDGSFPKGFLFGTAVAGFQADMGCPTLPSSECEDPNSDWYQFVTSPVTLGDPQTYLSGDSPSAGPGQWELYEKDFELARNELVGNAARLSLEWSRVFPTATDAADGYDALRSLASPRALDHYHAVFSALRARNMTPLVTLNHYSLPLWIHDGAACHQNPDTCSPKGWVDKDRTVREIAKYAGFAAREFGAEVDLWATLNEPFAVLLPGYLLPSPDRTNPPALLLRLADLTTVFAGLVEAHARMYDAVKAADTFDADGDGSPAAVGVVYAMAPVRPKDASRPLDVQAADNVFYLWNMAYLNAVVKGEMDSDFDGRAEPRPDLAGRMDYLGVNYYTRVTVEGTPAPVLEEFSPLTTFNPLSLQVWEDYPRGIYEMVLKAREMGLPAIVTENGAPDPDDDGTAPSYLVRHLAWLQRAIEEGADVRGYFYWTFMDNYEWNHGMNVRMGLYGVDKDDPTKTRRPRQAVAAYRAIAQAGRIPEDLAERYPAE